METYKNSWKDHYENETLVEEITYNSCRVVFVHVKNQESFIKYKYRMLAFNSYPIPFLILNLETSDSLAPLYCLGKNEGVLHENLGVLNNEMTYSDFRRWALNLLDKELSASKSSETKRTGKIVESKISKTTNQEENAVEKKEVIETLMQLTSLLKLCSNEAQVAYDEINKIQGSFWTAIKTLFGIKTDYEKFQIITANLESKSGFITNRTCQDSSAFAGCNDKEIQTYFGKIENFSKNLFGFCKLLNMRQMISSSAYSGEIRPVILI